MSNARGFLAFDPNRPADGRHDARELSERDLSDQGRARAGDEQAFAVLYRRHSPAVFRYAWLLTGSESGAAGSFFSRRQRETRARSIGSVNGAVWSR